MTLENGQYFDHIRLYPVDESIIFCDDFADIGM